MNVLILLDLKMNHIISGNFKNLRFSNLSMAGGTLSLVYMISLFSGIILFYKKKISLNIFIFGFTALIFSMILTGRIGLYLFALISFSILTYKFFKSISKKKLLLIKKFTFIIFNIFFNNIFKLVLPKFSIMRLNFCIIILKLNP